MYQTMAKSNPQLAEMMSDPEFIKQMFTKENIQTMRQLQQSNIYPQMDGFGMGVNRTVENLSPDDIRIRYPDAIHQIEDMGFTVDDHVLQVLHRFEGDVQSTINFLMGFCVCFK